MRTCPSPSPLQAPSPLQQSFRAVIGKKSQTCPPTAASFTFVSDISVNSEKPRKTLYSFICIGEGEKTLQAIFSKRCWYGPPLPPAPSHPQPHQTPSSPPPTKPFREVRSQATVSCRACFCLQRWRVSFENFAKHDDTATVHNIFRRNMLLFREHQKRTPEKTTRWFC